MPEQHSRALVPWTYAETERFALSAFKSGMFQDLLSVNQAIVKIQLGHEIGIGPATSLRAVQVIQNAPCLSANTMAALIKRSNPRYNYKTLERSLKRAAIMFYAEGEELGEAEFTIEDALKAKLWPPKEKSGWEKYPKAMLWARAISLGFKIYCGDLAFGGNVYTAEEVGGVDVDVPEGEIIKVTSVPEAVEVPVTVSNAEGNNA